MSHYDVTKKKRITMDISKIIDFIKLPPKYYLAFVIFSGTLLFSPDNFTQKLGMYEFVNQWRPLLGIVFLFFTSLLMVHVIIMVLPLVKILWKRISYKENLKKKIYHLSKPEKKILFDYIEKNTKTQEFQISDGVINGMEHLGFVYRSSNFSVFDTYWAYNIQPSVWVYLKKNFEEVFSQDEILEYRKENRKNK